MRLSENLTGRVFGKSTVLGMADRPPGKTKGTWWRVQCECGRESVLASWILKKRGRSKGGGCAGCAERRPKDFVGIRVGLLTVTAKAHIGQHREQWWTCRCDCGETVIRSSPYLCTAEVLSCDRLVCKREARKLRAEIAHQHKGE